MRGHCGHSFPLARVAGGCHELEVHHGLAPVSKRGADAIHPRVAAADHHHLLPLGVDVVPVLEVRVEKALGVGVQEIHGEVHPVEVSAVHGQIPWLRRAARQHDGVRRVSQLGDGRVSLLSDVRVDDEIDTPAARMSARRCTISICPPSCWAPYIINPHLSARSATVTLCPALLS